MTDNLRFGSQGPGCHAERKDDDFRTGTNDAWRGGGGGGGGGIKRR